jgi:hypothetical protein
MIIDINSKSIVDKHWICISNKSRDKFLTLTPKPSWTDNICLAICFDSEEDAIKFEEQPEIEEFLSNELELLIWTDTRQSIY